MRLFLALFVFAATAAAAPVPPSPLTATPQDWAAFTKGAVEDGGFAAWRDALGEKLRAELPPASAAKVDAPGAALALAQWEFLRGALAAEPDGLATVARAPQGKEFLAWLLTNREALDDYNAMAGIFQLSKKRAHGIEGWREIWVSCPESRAAGLWQRVAAACAVAFAEKRQHATPRERFDFYRTSHAAGQLVPSFDKAPAFELALIVHADGRGNDELEWAQDATPKNKKVQNQIGDYGHSLISYRGDNYRGQTVQGPNYYDRKRNDLSTVMEYGGVCGMVSHMNSTVTNAHGVAAFTAGQPGHCAYVWKRDDKTWSGGNFVSGWPETYDSHQLGFWLSRYSANINLVSEAVASPGFAKADRLRLLGAVWREKDAAHAAAIGAAATAAAPLHYGAWKERIAATLDWKDAPATAWRTLGGEVLKSFPKYPVAMNDLCAAFDKDRLMPGYTDTQKVAAIAATARALTSVPHGQQWDLIYPTWKPWFARQLTALGIPEKRAMAVTEARTEAKKGETPADVWAALDKAKRPQFETLFATLLPAVETNAGLFKDVAAAWLTLVAADTQATARAQGYFQKRLATAADVRKLEMFAGAMLTATRDRADSRADLVAAIRKRAGEMKKPDPGAMDSLLGLLAKNDFRDASRIGEWKGAQFPKGGEQTLEWDLTPLLAKAAGEYALHLNFRWTAGAPLAVKSVKLFENDKELNADGGAETASVTLQPAVFTVRLPAPKTGAKYSLRATASGGADSAGVVLSRAEPIATFKKDEWAEIGGWGDKEITAAPVVTEGWYDMEFDATKHLRAAGPVFVLFKYSSYGSPRVANVRLLVDGREVSSDLHSCNPISGANTMYALRLPPLTRDGAKVTVRALFTKAGGWGGVFVRKQAEEKKHTASR